MLATQLKSEIETVETPKDSEQQPKRIRWQPMKLPSLLQAIIEGFVDGVLIVNDKGEWVHANEQAHLICRQIYQYTSQNNLVPQPIWQICESLLESRELFPDQKIIIESEIEIDDSATFRIRVRWLDLEESDRPYLLITLEDRCQSTQNVVVTDAKKYNLTAREAEVWLLRRSKLSYKEIAARLYITTNTVKKHLKNIYAKQQEIGWAQEDW
ncbi:MAG TPA: helix-turn-helix transcriptional regulator [Cyanobacteria bacterium UBA8803]|nr:helix-turn-helix transcriptional regulator [Cyanobacteria bacterium UBA9273]HBL59921.1 helix-turn-helix transcriptional regulator [Cyanobacteria bacterium UBA8803]